MLQAILETLKIMGWLGIILFILSTTNIIVKTLINVWSQVEDFSGRKMFKGISKVIVFYIGSIAVSIAFTMLPFVNEMIIDAFDVMLFSNDALTTLSSVAVLAIVATTIVTQGSKAIKAVMELSKISTGEKEEITWDVEENPEEEEAE